MRLKMSLPIISLRDIWVRYNSRIVLEDINFSIEEKEILSIVGPNGSGKSTLLKTIMGFKEPFRGEVKVMGNPPTKIMKTGIVGYLPQDAHLDSHFPIKAFDVVAMSRYAGKFLLEMLNSDDIELIHGALEKVEMLDFKDHHFGSLSGGQKQRVLIARALAIKPKILVLDEPATGLDAVAQDSFYHLLSGLRDSENLTIIMVSHDIGSVSLFVDKIACLNRRIHFHGKPEDCIPSEALEKVFGKNVNFLLHDKKCETCERRKW
jgi:zinc transport system ATP-binding protein